ARAFENFAEKSLSRNTMRAKSFRTFVKNHSAWIEGYALFRVLMEENAGSEMWDRWPAEHATVEAARRWLESQPGDVRARLDRHLQFHMYVQWLAFAQWIELKKYCNEK